MGYRNNVLLLPGRDKPRRAGYLRMSVVGDYIAQNTLTMDYMGKFFRDYLVIR